MGRPTEPDRVKHIGIGPEGIDAELKEAPIDRLALDFCAILDQSHVEYAIVGGYVAILLGWPRESDNVDIIANGISRSEFVALHEPLRPSS